MKIKKTSKARILLVIMLISIVTSLSATLQSCEDKKDFDMPGITTEENIVKHKQKISNTTIEEKSPQNKQKNIEYTSVKAPKSTNKLIVYSCSFNEHLLTPAINIFKKKYPDVKVEYREFKGKPGTTEGVYEYYQVLKTELAAGKGPDLIVAGPEIENIYKLMDSGALIDLNSFLENDSGFNFDNYNKVVLDSGIYGGKRYVMPLEYKVPVIITTKQILDKEGIKLSNLNTFNGFINTINKYNEKYKNNSKKSVFQKHASNWAMIVNYNFPWCGIDLINYSTKKVGIDNPNFKTVMETMKWAYVPQKDSTNVMIGGSSITIQALHNQEWLFDFSMGNIETFIAVHGGLNSKKLTPVFFTYPNIDDKTTAMANTFAAINKASQNQVNAYNLLKILLSEDIQSKSILDIPVLNSSINKVFEQVQKDYKSLGMKTVTEKEEVDKYINMLSNVDSCKLMEYTSYTDFFIKDIVPYYEGKQSFEQFVKILKNKLEIYISE